MKNYKVIKEKGVRTIAGELKKKGQTFLGSPRSATIQLQLRCQEIEEVKEKEAEPEPPKEPAPKEPAPKEPEPKPKPKEPASKK